MNTLHRRMFLQNGTMGLIALGTMNHFAHAAPTTKELDILTEKAYAGLKPLQNKDGSFAPKLGGPGITALVVSGLIRNGHDTNDPVVAQAMKYLESNIRADGGIYSQRLANYSTCVALMTFEEANKDGKYDKVIANATKFLKGLQGADASESESGYGGVGYDGSGRADLSNTHFFVDALISAGVSKDDPSIQKAVTYISRCQNLKSEFNQLPYASKVTEDDKGGFVYTPSEAEKKEGKNQTAAGGLRSQGSMTYAGLKSLLYAGVSKDDPRIKAAVEWIGQHYTVTENPGQKDAGLFYYYHLFAKAMMALDQPMFTDASGKKHDWRQDLSTELKNRQTADGTWTNKNNAFFEGSPELATAFALLALSYCKPETK